MMWSKGFGAAETKAAFSRASEFAVGAVAAERFPAYYGLWAGRLLRGELAAAQETAEIFLREANTEGHMTEAAVASRILGTTCFWQGHFVEARAHLENSLKTYNPERDRDAKRPVDGETADERQREDEEHLEVAEGDLAEEVPRALHVAERAGDRLAAAVLVVH